MDPRGYTFRHPDAPPSELQDLRIQGLEPLKRRSGEHGCDQSSARVHYELSTAEEEFLDFEGFWETEDLKKKGCWL